MRKKHVIRDNIPVIIVTSIISMIGSLSLGYANNILYAGNEVSYDNSVSGLNSVTVQGALDELCTAADFSDRVSTLEKYFKNNPTSYFTGNDLNLGINSTDGNTTLRLHDSTGHSRSVFQYNASQDKTYIYANDSTTLGAGTLDLRGSPVKINGADLTKSLMMDKIVTTSAPYEISVGNYSSLVIIGFAQGVGPVILGVTRNVNTLTVRNLMTNANFSSSYLTVTLSNNKVVIATTASGNSVFTIIRGGV